MGRRWVVDVGLGFAALVLVVIMEALVTLPFGEPDPGQLREALNREFLLTALPALAVTALLAYVAKTAEARSGVRRGLIWAGIFAGAYAVLGVANGTISGFATIGAAVLLVSLVLGPVLAGYWRARSSAARPLGRP